MEQNLPQETLQSVKEYLPKLASATEKVATHFQSGDNLAASQLLLPIFEGVQWVTSAISLLQQHGYCQQIELSGLLIHLREMEQALSNGDTVLLSDLFEYEITPLLQEWITVLEEREEH
jgi:hypothetical protein